MSISKTDHNVSDVMLPLDKVPVVTPKSLLKETLAEMNQYRLGIASMVDDAGVLLGIFTDGDIRRMLLKDQKPFPALFADDIQDHATINPAMISKDSPLAVAIALMEEKEIWDLPVVDEENHLVGLLHLHPAIKAVMNL